MKIQMNLDISNFQNENIFETVDTFTKYYFWHRSLWKEDIGMISWKVLFDHFMFADLWLYDVVSIF